VLLHHIVTYVTLQLYQLADIIEKDTAEPVNTLVMAALRNTCRVFLLSFFFFSSPNLSGRRVDFYHTSKHGMALVRI